MPAKKKTEANPTTSTYEEALEVGYLGSTPDPHPNEAYSLKSGPDSPSATEVREALVAAEEPKKEGDAK